MSLARLFLGLLLAAFCFAACAPSIRSDVEAQVYLTQSAINRTATVEWQATKTAQDVLDSQVEINQQQAEQLRLENEKALVELERARRELDDATLAREMERQRQQAEWEAEQDYQNKLRLAIIVGIILIIAVIGIIIGYQFFLFTDGVRQLQYNERYQKSQVEIWRLRAESSRNILEATQNARRKTSQGEMEWDYEASQWRPALPPPAIAPPPASLETRWRTAAYHAGLWAAQYGFSETAFKHHNLVRDANTGQFWEEGRRTLMEILDRLGVTYARQGKARDWAGGWDAERFERDFLSLPFPKTPEIAVPVVSIPLRGSEVVEDSPKFRGSEVENPLTLLPT